MESRKTIYLRSTVPRSTDRGSASRRNRRAESAYTNREAASLALPLPIES